MSDWWGYMQVLSYVRANYPCSDGPETCCVVDDKIEDGTLPTRFAPGGANIDPGQWYRTDTGRLDISGSDFTADTVEFQAEAVRRLCARKQEPKNAGGRPPKYDYEGGLIHLAKLVFNNPAFSNPTEDQLITAMRQWMADNDADGGVPDAREIRKKVSRFYNEVIGEG